MVIKSTYKIPLNLTSGLQISHIAAVTQVQATLRTRILHAFVSRGLLQNFESMEMLAYRHSGFSVDTSVRIEAHDRAALERLLRYCARPPFSMERLRKAGNELVYRCCAKQHSEPTSDKRGAKWRIAGYFCPSSLPMEPAMGNSVRTKLPRHCIRLAPQTPMDNLG